MRSEGPRAKAQGPRILRGAAILLLIGGGALAQDKSFGSGFFALAQDKKEAPKPAPKALFAAPLSVKPGATTRLLIRGLSLEQASEAKAAGALEVKIKSKGKATVPANQEAGVYGDTQVEVEIKTAADASGELELEIVTPAGRAPALKIPIASAVAEKEPNGGFAQAQALEPGRIVEGAIGGAKDVDVFKLDAKAGETWTIEVTAARLGSPLDPVLMAHDAAGLQIAMADDSSAGRDPLLTLKIPADGVYYVSLIDAHDMGGPTHAYLLAARR